MLEVGVLRAWVVRKETSGPPTVHLGRHGCAMAVSSCKHLLSSLCMAVSASGVCIGGAAPRSRRPRLSALLAHSHSAWYMSVWP